MKYAAADPSFKFVAVTTEDGMLCIWKIDLHLQSSEKIFSEKMFFKRLNGS